MQEISLNILDIVQNSIRAGATVIDVVIEEAPSVDVFAFTVKDNGCGMDEEMVKRVTDPFVTTRTTRKVGLGISLLKSLAQQAGGDIKLESKVGVGTVIRADFSYSHIDRQPLGDISAVMVSLISMNPDIDFVYSHSFEKEEFTLDTRELRKILGEDVSLSEISVAAWIGDYINENLTEIYGGAK
ncbi:MAG: ATP-binding protein [Ruminococcaceae bacterium]|nr:ATP-binding protein [Oscillospiraceae bacterium]